MYFIVRNMYYIYLRSVILNREISCIRYSVFRFLLYAKNDKFANSKQYRLIIMQIPNHHLCFFFLIWKNVVNAYPV
jgi:hypothetical protein